MAEKLPRSVRRLVDRWVDRRHREPLLGDLEEAWAAKRSACSPLRAWLWVHRQTLAALWPLRSRRRPRPALGTRLRGLFDDLRWAARFQRRRPAFLAVVTLTLALGIGATATIWSVVDAVLVRPLPWPRAHELAAIRSVDLDHADGELTLLSYPDFEALREHARSASAWAAVRGEQLNLEGHGMPERLAAAAVDHRLFGILGARAIAGRAFAAADDRPGAALTTVLGYGLWQRRFGGDPSVVGRSIRLHGELYAVIGVMPPGMRFPFGRTELWITAAQRPGTAVRGHTSWFVLGRRAPESSLAAMNKEIGAVARRLGEAFPDTNGDRTFVAEPFRQTEVGHAARPLELLLGAVVAVLLIACVNVANMLLTRAGSRRADIAMRRALGATRGRLLRTFLAENALIAGLGGALGVLLAHAALPVVLAWSPQDVPGLDRAAVDHRVLAVAVALTAACALAFAVVELLDARGRSDASSLRPAARTVVRGGRLGGALVVVEVALAVVLVSGAGLLLKTLWRLSGVDPGLRPERVLAVEVELPRAFISDAWAHNIDFFTALRARAAELPGVRTASVAYRHPLDPGWRNGFAIVGREETAADDWSATFRPVAPGYFAAMGIPLLGGRDLDASDRAGRPGAVVVNETLARRFFSGEQALGKTLIGSSWWGDATPSSFEIVGVVADVRSAGLDLPPSPATYFAHAQVPVNPMTLLLRTAGEPLDLVDAVRALVADLDPTLPVGTVTTLEAELAATVAPRRFVARLLGAFAAVALALAAVGLYGVLSFAVASRRREIGLRSALGARAPDIARMVLTRGLALTSAGLAVGLVATLAMSRLLGDLLYDVAPTDPATLGAVSATLLLVAAVACLAPLRRALGVDPNEVLRQE